MIWRIICDILKKVKANPELANLGKNVSRIRQSQKRASILKLKKSKNVIADKLLSLLGKFLRQKTDITASRLEVNIAYKLYPWDHHKAKARWFLAIAVQYWH